MRTRFVVIAAPLLLTAQVALAQEPPTKPAPPDVPMNGLVDVGVRAGATDGDEARFERYQDLRPGASTMFDFTKNTDTYLFGFKASNVGYRDQKYTADYYTGKLKVSGFFDSIPLNYLYDAPYVWSSDGEGRFTLPADLRQQVQGPTNVNNDGTAVGVPCAPGAPPASCSASTADAALANRSVYNQIIAPDDMQVRRDTIGAKLAYEVTPAVAFDVDLSSYSRTGEMPWIASYSFNNANELPLPIEQRNNELKLGTEWVNPKGMLRVDYWGSFFGNDIQTLVWDNPIRATDFNNGLAPPSGPYDSSAYSNGNGPASGQEALWPSNNLNSFGFTGMYKVMPRTTVNGNLQFTYLRQDEALLPWTTNSSINNPAVFAVYPALQGLPRSSADASVDALNALVNLNSRPLPYLNVQARFRFNDHDNTTPAFDGRTYVTTDGKPTVMADDPLTEHVEGFSEYFDIQRKNFDANGTFTLRQGGNLRVGYAYEGYDRHGRGFSETGENTFRLAYDATLMQVLQVRANYDVGQRRGDGFIISDLDYEEGAAGTQPGLRYFDEADRDRTRAALILSANPMENVGVFVQYTTTRDTFKADEFIPEGREQFGLLSQDVNAFAAGVDFSPRDMIHVGFSYGYDKYDSTQKSRNANPPPDPTWTDPARNWFLDNQDAVTNIGAYVDILGLMESKADLHFGYELNDSDNEFDHYGPRVDSLAAAGQFIPLPTIANTWSRFTVDFKYFVTRQVGFGIGYLYEDLDITDYATIDTNGSVGFTPATGTPRIDYLGGLVTGYGNRPYTGNRVFARALYRF